jgi:hypothetical protein
MTFYFTGQVERLYVRGSSMTGCFIRLRDIAPADATLPKEEYFYLSSDTPNYNALYSLALLAANGRHRLGVRTVSDTNPTQYAQILYLVLDW